MDTQKVTLKVDNIIFLHKSITCIFFIRRLCFWALIKSEWKDDEYIRHQNIFYSVPFFPVVLRPKAGHDLLILEVSRSHTTTHCTR